jgi:pimeloyl-ACP methyl ester carboxylesterase
VTLNYYRAGTGEPLVLMHGIGSRWEVYNSVLDRLSAEHDVIALDLPGFAGSPPPPPGTPAGIASLVRLVVEFLDEQGLERPHLVGNSMGGWIALELAKLGRASSVTGLSPAGFHTPREARYQRAVLASGVRITRFTAPHARRLFRSRAMRTVMLYSYVARPWAVSVEDTALTVEGAARATWFEEMLAAITQPAHFTGGERIDVPVTIAWGDHDRLLLPRQAARAGRLIPRARVITLKGCGHLPTLDDPEQVARVLGRRADARSDDQ